MVVLQMASPIECDSFVYIMSKQSDTEKINKKKIHSNIVNLLSIN